LNYGDKVSDNIFQSSFSNSEKQNKTKTKKTTSCDTVIPVGIKLNKTCVADTIDLRIIKGQSSLLF
jgi:hypothetical protein